MLVLRHSAAAPNGEIKQMSDAQIQQMVDVFNYYGQGTATIPHRHGQAHRLTPAYSHSFPYPS